MPPWMVYPSWYICLPGWYTPPGVYTSLCVYLPGVYASLCTVCRRGRHSEARPETGPIPVSLLAVYPGLPRSAHLTHLCSKGRQHAAPNGPPERPYPFHCWSITLASQTPVSLLEDSLGMLGRGPPYHGGPLPPPGYMLLPTIPRYTPVHTRRACTAGSPPR